MKSVSPAAFLNQLKSLRIGTWYTISPGKFSVNRNFFEDIGNFAGWHTSCV